MTIPKVSIVIPAFKDRGYLHFAIRSAKNQTYPDIEIILASDGNKALERYATHYQIKFCCLPKRSGLSKTFNLGVKHATGEYIKILPDDDRLPENCIADLVKGITEQKVDFVFANAQMYQRKPGIRTIMEKGWYLGRIVIPKNKNPSFAVLIKKNHIHGGTTMYRRDIVMKEGGYSPKMWTGEELEFHLRLLSKGYKLGYVNKVVFHYRIHETQKSGSKLDPSYWKKRVIAIRNMRIGYKNILRKKLSKTNT